MPYWADDDPADRPEATIAMCGRLGATGKPSAFFALPAMNACVCSLVGVGSVWGVSVQWWHLRPWWISCGGVVSASTVSLSGASLVLGGLKADRRSGVSGGHRRKGDGKRTFLWRIRDRPVGGQNDSEDSHPLRVLFYAKAVPNLVLKNRKGFKQV